VKVDETVFVHGGILQKHVAYGLDRMNDELDAWLSGERRDPPSVVVAEDGPVWTRAYSTEGDTPACSELSATLATLGPRRMVVGHTVQRGGANSACDGEGRLRVAGIAEPDPGRALRSGCHEGYDRQVLGGAR
jgi:hypothetical protein